MLCCLVVVVPVFQRNVLSPSSDLKEATGSSKALVPMDQTTQHHWSGHCSCTALDLYLGGAWFESWSGQVLSLRFLWFSSFLRQMLG